MKKFVDDHPFADRDAAARKIIEIANDVEAVQDGRIYIEASMRRSLRLAAMATTSVLGSSAPSLSAGCGGTRAGLT